MACLESGLGSKGFAAVAAVVRPLPRVSSYVFIQIAPSEKSETSEFICSYVAVFMSIQVGFQREGLNEQTGEGAYVNMWLDRWPLPEKDA